MDVDEIPTATIEAGEILFHGTSSDSEFEIPNGPAFFGDTFSVARNFSTWHEEGGDPRVLRFEVDKDIPNLALIESGKDFDRIAESLGLEPSGETQDRIDMVRDAGFDGWIIPNNYPDGGDILLFDPEKWLTFLDKEVL
jgi:hypothetical protein